MRKYNLYVGCMERLYSVLVILFVLLACSSGTKNPYAPDFCLMDVDSNLVTLYSVLTDGPVLMVTWALWCSSARRELDSLKSYYDEFESMGVQVLAISEDRRRSMPRVKPFALSRGWPYIILLDPDNEIRFLYNIQAMPTSMIIDQRGEILFTFLGYQSGDEEIIVNELRYFFGN